MSKFLAVLATVLFAVALILVVVGGADKSIITDLTLGGLTAFAGSHVS